MIALCMSFAHNILSPTIYTNPGLSVAVVRGIDKVSYWYSGFAFRQEFVARNQVDIGGDMRVCVGGGEREREWGGGGQTKSVSSVKFS